MATVYGPLMSLGASGKLANAIVFSSWKGRPVVRKWVIPANPKSALQIAVRAVLRFVTQDYANLSAADISDWEDEAAADNITPLNAQVRDAGGRARRNLGIRENTTDTGSGTPDDPINAAITAQPKTLVLTWDDPVANQPDYCWYIYGSKTTGFTPGIENLIGMTKHDVETFTHFGLTTGDHWYYRIRGGNTDGVLGDLCLEFDDVVL